MISNKNRITALLLALLMIVGIVAVPHQYVAADEAADQQYLEDAVAATWPYTKKILPEYGKDTNMLPIIEAKLSAKGYPGIKASLKSVDSIYPDDNRAGVDSDGTLKYFYRDPDDIMFPGVWEALWWRRVHTTIQLSYGEATKDISDFQVHLHWDQAKARDVLQSKVIDKVTYEYMLDQNPSATEVTTNLRLPKTVAHETLVDENGKPKKRLWSIISWETSDGDAIAIDGSNQGTADTLFDDYIGKVKRGKHDREVTLTATYSFQYARSEAEEANIKQVRTYTFVVKGLSDTSGIEEELKGYLDHYTVDKLTYWLLKTPLDPAAVDNDIQFLLKESLGIPDNEVPDFRLEVLSDNHDVIEPYYYRGIVYRPLPGEAAENVVLTVKLTHKDSGIFVTKEIPLTVKPLEQSEIDSALQLMKYAKTHYFDGINDDRNPDKDHVAQDLHAFEEVNWRDSAHDELAWFYTTKEGVYQGVRPDDIDPSRPSEKWNLFKSSRPDIITHENLLVTRPQYTTNVTIQSVLTHGVFGKYAEKYPDHETFRQLYRQPVEVTVKVLGTDGDPIEPEPEMIEGTLTVVGARILNDPDTEPEKPLYMYWEENIPYSVPAGTTALEMTRTVLTAKGYTIETSNHIDSLTHPDGTTLKNFETNGKMATWLWRLNEKYAEDYASEYYLQSGDAIKWYFTNDWKSDYDGNPENYLPKVEGKLTVTGARILQDPDATPDEPLYRYWVKDFPFSVPQGTNAMEAVKLTLEPLGFTVNIADGQWGPYLYSIKNPAGDELIGGETNGPLSGWMFRYNDAFSDVGAGQVTVKTGDHIHFYYSNNYRNVDYIGDPDKYVPLNGWYDDWNGDRYYYRDDVAVTGLQEIEEELYFFDKHGVMQTGWKVFGNEVRYFDPENEGKAAIGLTRIGKTTYLFDDNGLRQDGWHVINGVAMYFDPNHGGGRITGLRTIGKTTYLLSATEGKLSGWHVINGKAMYFDPNFGCGRITGKRTIGHTTYLLTAEGKQYGWHILNGGKYYFAPEYGGGMLTGLRQVGNGTYFFRTADGEGAGEARGAALINDSIILNGKTYSFGKTGLLIP